MLCPKCQTESEGCKFCPSCGNILISDVPPQSPEYGQPTNQAPQYQQAPPQVVVNNYAGGANMDMISQKSRLVALLLCVFLGGIGVHRFYAGKIGTGILWLFTGGCFGIGYLVDIIMIACGTFKDSFGLPIIRWDA